MSAPAITYADLLGHRWSALEAPCWECMRTVLARVGRAAPESLPGESDGLEGNGLRGLRRGLGAGAVKVGDWPCTDLALGDVLAIDGRGRGRVDHVAVVISLVPLRVLHTSRSAGCHALDPRFLAGVRAVYRFPPVNAEAYCA